MLKKSYDELCFTDDFLFCKVMTTNLDLCKELLELILGIKIKKINLSEAQKWIKSSYESKGIRLDVYLDDDDNTVYDLEMQTGLRDDLPKRSRYYQGIIDSGLMRTGGHYKDLKRSYVIFICTFDPFKENRVIYTFENRCVENTDICLKDEAYKIFINALGNREDMSKDMCDFLDLLQGKKLYSGLAGSIQREVDKAIAHDEWRVEYMEFCLKIQEEREEARKEGREEGREEGIKEGIKEGVMSERISVIRKLLSYMSEEEIIACMGYSTEDIEMAKTAQ